MENGRKSWGKWQRFQVHLAVQDDVSPHFSLYTCEKETSQQPTNSHQNANSVTHATPFRRILPGSTRLERPTWLPSACLWTSKYSLMNGWVSRCDSEWNKYAQRCPRDLPNVLSFEFTGGICTIMPNELYEFLSKSFTSQQLLSVYFFGWPSAISLSCVWCTSLTKNSWNSKVVFNH